MGSQGPKVSSGGQPRFPSDLMNAQAGLRLHWSYMSFCLSLAPLLYELGHEKMCLMSYANNKGADQPVHLRSLISAFVVHCLDSIISLDSIAKI